MEKTLYMACARLSDFGFTVKFCENEIVITRKDDEKVIIDKNTADLRMGSSYEFDTAVLKTLLPLMS